MQNQNNTNLVNLVQQAKQAVRFQNLDQAKSAFYNILIHHPNNTFALRGIKKLKKNNLDPLSILMLNIKRLFGDHNYSECEIECLKVLRTGKQLKEIFLYLGLSLFRQGKFIKAIDNYNSALKIYKQDVDIIVNLGNALKGNLDYKSAIDQYRVAISIDKNFIPALINIAELYNRINEYQTSHDFSIKAINLDPTSDKVFCNLGNSYLGMGQLQKALDTYEEGLKFNSTSEIIIHNKALTLMKLKNYKDALKVFKNGFTDNILMKTSLIDYGLCLFEIGELNKSLLIYKQALKYIFNSYELHNNLANLYSNLGEYELALAQFTKAKSLNPENKEVYFNIALNFFNQTMYEEAIENCLIAIKYDEKFYQAYNLLGSSYQNKGIIEKAIKCFEIAIRISPNCYTSFFNYGFLCLNNGRVSDALNLLQKAKDLKCPFDELNYLLNAAKFNNLDGISDYLDDFLQLFEKEKNNYAFISSYFLPVLYCDELSNDKIFELHKKFDTTKELIKVKKNNNEKIRIGYVSADLTGHSVGYFFLPLIKNHDHENFEIFIYFNNRTPDFKTKIFKSYCKNWRNIFDKDDGFVIDLIKKDYIDILVDLSGHTAGGRLEVFRNKPAYKQITWLGYPDTTGLKSIDYKFTDSISDPKDISDKFYTEKLYRIPDSFLCYENSNYIHINSKKPLKDNNFVTFGSFNNIKKISKNNLNTWVKLLKKLPKSRLVLKSIQYSSQDITKRFLEIFIKNNIDIDRITLLPGIPSIHGHLSMYNMIDISLDTFPFNGATTTMESLWMGVPVITLEGKRHVSRVGTSILRNLNLDNLIAKNEEEYVELSIELSKNIDLLNYYQSNLRNNLEKSNLCDGKSFAKKIEYAYKEIFSE